MQGTEPARMQDDVYGNGLSAHGLTDFSKGGESSTDGVSTQFRSRSVTCAQDTNRLGFLVNWWRTQIQVVPQRISEVLKVVHVVDDLHNLICTDFHWHAMFSLPSLGLRSIPLQASAMEDSVSAVHQAKGITRTQNGHLVKTARLEGVDVSQNANSQTWKYRLQSFWCACTDVEDPFTRVSNRA